jgi:tape measure domain-containing protein
MSAVDDRVVRMQFENEEFQKRLSTTLQSLNKLSDSLRLEGSEKGFKNAAAAADGFDVSHMSSALDHISGKFSAMGAIGFSVIQNLTASALSFAKKIGEDVLGPILSGGKSRAENIEQAKFQFRGLGIDVEKGMASALAAVKGTSYGLDQAAKIAAQFGASGIAAGDQMTSALRGIAGAAAMTGSNFAEIGDIFTSAAGAGKVGNQELNQFATRGLNAAAAVGKVMGKTEAQIHQMATDGQLDFKTFAAAMDKAFGAHATQANETYSGSLANVHAAMSRLGAVFFTPRLEQQRDLFNALTPVIDNVTSAITPLINTVTALGRISTDKLIGGLKGLDLTPLKNAIPDISKALRNIFDAFTQILGIGKKAFREIFPPGATSFLKDFSGLLLQVSESLTLNGKTADKVKRIFAGVFAVFDIVGHVLKEVIIVIASFISEFRGTGGGVVDLGAKFGDLMVRLDDFLIKGGALHRFFVHILLAINPISDVLKKVSDAVSAFTYTLRTGKTEDEGTKIERLALSFRHLLQVITKDVKEAVAGIKSFVYTLRTGLTEDEGTTIEHVALAIRNFFGIFTGAGKEAGKDADVVLGRVHSRFDNLKNLLERLSPVIDGVRKVLGAIFGAIGNWLAELGHNIVAALKPGDFNAAVDAVNVGLLGGILLLLKRFLDGTSKIDLTGGLFNKAKKSLDVFTEKMKAVQTELKAKALMEIAGAVAILTGSILVLSLIDSAALAKSMTALAVGFAQLVGAMKLLDTIASDASGATRLAILAGAMILMASAALILSGAVAVLGNLGVDTLAKGLTGLSVGLGLMVGAIEILQGTGPGVLLASLAMVGMATAMTIMAGAVALFGQMSWGEMVKGLLGLGLALGVIVGTMTAMPIASLLAAGLAMIPLATGLVILAGAVKLFATMSGGELIKGFVALDLLLGSIAATMTGMPVTLPITAAGLVLVAIALDLMVPAVKMMASINLGSLVKGLVGIAALMGILAVSVNLMSGAVGGALALLIVSHSLSVLVEVLKTLSALSWGDLVKGLVAIAGVLGVLGLAALVLEPVIPALMGLGVAMALIGGGFALFGVGALLVAKALQAMAEMGVGAVKALIEGIELFLKEIPMFSSILVGSLLKSAGDVLNASQLMLNILTVLLVQVLDTVIKLSPKIAEALVAIITNALILIRAKFPDVMVTAYLLLITLLNTIREHMSEVTQVAIDIVINFAETLTANVQRLTDAAVNLLLAFLGAIGARVDDIQAAALNLILSFIAGMVNNVFRIIDFAVSTVIVIAQTIANESGRLLRAGGDALIQFVQGVASNIYRVTSQAVDVAIAFVDAIGNEAVRFARGAADALIHFLNGLADAIREKSAELRKAGVNIADAIIDGVTGGLADKAEAIPKKIGGIFGKAINVAKDVVDSHSPSRVFMQIARDMIAGSTTIFDKDTSAEASVVSHAERIVQAFADTLTNLPHSLDGIETGPVITPVLDLTKVKSAAAGLDQLMTNPVISPEVSFAQARTIATTAEIASSTSEPKDVVPREIKFEQNIYSPEALSTNDVYKGTRSQLALAKEELNIP